MILYYSPGSCSFASLVALEMTGLDYEARKLDFSANEQRSDDYLGINPKGRVPALVTDKGILTETPAILTYIAAIQPDSKLAPLEDPWAYALMQSFNAYLCATVHVAHAHRHRGYRWADKEASYEDMRNKVPQTMGDCFALIEKDMFKGPWVLGDTFSTSDIYLLTIARWLELDGVDTQPLPRVMDHRERMLEQPAVKRVIDANR
ncbi:MAG: glutathione S-transferase family protein [Gammaproteobacteria bacterium]|nr:glutathione S-transferase family protein [Gammaproteobacteria bacterium]